MSAVRCVRCRVLIPDDADAHTYHAPKTCDRFARGWCSCDEWVCPSCCLDCAIVTPLAARLREANAAHRAEREAEDASLPPVEEAS